MPARHDPLTAQDAQTLASLIAPRLEGELAEKLEPKFAALHAKMDQLSSDVSGLKAKSRMWGAIGGAVTSAPSWLPALFSKLSGH